VWLVSPETVWSLTGRVVPDMRVLGVNDENIFLVYRGLRRIYNQSTGWTRGARGPAKINGGRLDVAATVAAWAQGGGK
jgi:hypothetical protein